MVDPRASRFWLAGLQSGLLEPQALEACWEGIAPEKRTAPEHLDRRLARQAVQQGHLTLWQAQQLLAGRTNGFRVDRYLLLDLLGHGGMGRVYLARDTRLGRQVALKILAPERMSNPRAIARFQREARVGAQLQHENLVRIYDFGESQGRYFLVMEYIEGKTIGALIAAQGPMPPATAARLTRQIALGLEHAHRKGLIHRDVNPYNILVTHEGIAKLTDLGLAIDLAEEERVTREGATVGTFDYVAPEQARHSHAADIRSDIYSLGCSLYHMMAGQVPFPSPSLPEKLFAHQALEPTPLDQVVPDIPPGLVEVVRRMMRKQPDERYVTPLQVAQALEPFVEEYARLHDTQAEPLSLIPDDQGEVRTVVPPASAVVGAAQLSPAGVQAAGAYASGAAAAGPSGEPAVVGAVVKAESAPALTPSFLTPVSDQEVAGDEDVPLILDLGPDPPLTDSLSRPRPWFGYDRPAGSPPEAGLDAEGRPPGPPPAWRTLLADHPWIWPWGVAATALALGILAVVLLWRRPDGAAVPEPRPPATGPGADAAPPAETKADRPDARSPEASITVQGPDGHETPFEHLRDAIDHAVGEKGWVVFHNREPLRLPAASYAATTPRGGVLKLRSAEGVGAVLAVELVAGQPVFGTGSGASLIMDGLTIVARPPQPRAGSPAPPASAATPAPGPLVLAAGEAQFRHCAFAYEGAGPAARAIVVDGGKLTVENCWFRGFGTAMAVQAAAGTTTRVQQTLAVAASPGPGAAEGWLLRVEYMGGGKADSPRRLVLDHCTVAAAGLVQLAGFSQASPIRVDIEGCAVQAGTLVRWEPALPGAAFDARSVLWRGKGNLFDVSGPSWVDLAGKAAPGSTNPVGNLEAWSLVVTESEPVTEAGAFPARPADTEALIKPHDYAVRAAGPRRVGADPAQVGPRPGPPSPPP